MNWVVFGSVDLLSQAALVLGAHGAVETSSPPAVTMATRPRRC
jgi:hypothetical protein